MTKEKDIPTYTFLGGTRANAEEVLSVAEKRVSDMLSNLSKVVDSNKLYVNKRINDFTKEIDDLPKVSKSMGLIKNELDLLKEIKGSEKGMMEISNKAFSAPSDAEKDKYAKELGAKTEERKKSIEALEKIDPDFAAKIGPDRDNRVALSTKISELEKPVENSEERERLQEELDLYTSFNSKHLSPQLEAGLVKGMGEMNELMAEATKDAEIVNMVSGRSIDKNVRSRVKDIEKMLEFYESKLSNIEKLKDELDKLTRGQSAKSRRERFTGKVHRGVSGRSSSDVGDEIKNETTGLVDMLIKDKGRMAEEEAGKAFAYIAVVNAINKDARANSPKPDNYLDAAKNLDAKSILQNINEKLGLVEHKGSEKTEENKTKAENPAKDLTKETKKRVDYGKTYGWHKPEMTAWINELNAYMGTHDFAKDTAEKLFKERPELEEQIKKKILNIEDARIIYAEVIKAKAGHDFTTDKKEKNHFNVAINKLYEDFSKGEKDKKEVTQLMYALDLSYEAANNEAAVRAKVSSNKDDMALLDKAININKALKEWLVDESAYEYKRLLKELEELDEKERERLYQLLRGVSVKPKVVPSPSDVVEEQVGGGSSPVQSVQPQLPITEITGNTGNSPEALANPDSAKVLLRK